VTTRVPLDGKHRALTCDRCHAAETLRNGATAAPAIAQRPRPVPLGAPGAAAGPTRGAVLGHAYAAAGRGLSSGDAEARVIASFQPEIVRIDERHVTLNTADGERQVINDRVIVQIGGQPPGELLRTIGIELVEKRGEA